MTEPRVAITLLQSFCRDEALIGDIIEEYQRRQSRSWLWRQVAVVVLLAFPSRMIRRSRRGKMHMPIGGLGLLSVIALITFVAPGAWWLIGMGIVGGVVVAGIMIASGVSSPQRHRDTLSLK
jgi:predicted Kef-type K+ transport protein